MVRLEIERLTGELAMVSSEVDVAKLKLESVAHKVEQLSLVEREIESTQLMEPEKSTTDFSKVKPVAPIGKVEASGSISAKPTQPELTRGDMILKVLKEHPEHGLTGKAIAMAVIEKWEHDTPWKRIAGECCRLHSLSRLKKDPKTKRYNLPD